MLNIHWALKNKFLLVSALVVFLGFFLIGLVTLSDYGINWDEPDHFTRGQAYLHYFLTGKKDYQSLKTNPPPRRSAYQIDYLDASWWMQNDSGHPPFNDILAAFSNYIFYQKLGILRDVESYNLFILLVSSLLVGLVFWWAAQEYGIFAGIIACLSLALYPLFLAESHFDIKDPVETFFFALTIYGFYQGVEKKSWRWFLVSALACGFALGTKFNILFVPLIIIPWLIARGIRRILSKKILKFLVFYPVIVISIFFISWPFLWQDPFIRLWNTFRYYQQIGSGNTTQPSSFYIFGFNTYPIQTVIFTTPVVILFFSLLGIIAAFLFFKKEKAKPSLLFLLWFFLPILRVSLPGASIYGGTRQIMEYIPAMALLAGIGAETLRRKAILLFPPKKLYNFLIIAVILVSFIPITLKMVSIHPNQNAYFNPLIGGLRGARDKNYPYWGLTLGSVYKQGVDWLNKNAEKDARVALVIGTAPNIPKSFFRKDIQFNNGFWSSSRHEGEYLIETVYQDWIRVWYYDGEYVDRFLRPVYEAKVDGVPILKIWKNDKEHVYPQYLKEEQLSYQVKWQVKGDQIFLELPEARELMKISWNFTKNDCALIESGQVSLSADGVSWISERQQIHERNIGNIISIDKEKINYPLAAKKARYIRIQLTPKNTCSLRVTKMVVEVLAS